MIVESLNVYLFLEVNYEGLILLLMVYSITKLVRSRVVPQFGIAKLVQISPITMVCR